MSENSLRRYPLKLKPLNRSAIWGGSRLSDKFRIAPAGTEIAEDWCLSFRDGKTSEIGNGIYSGKLLSDFPRDFFGFDTTDFPLLIKYIDAADDLSVQVHPSDESCKADGMDCHGKSEMWYVIEADKDAEILYGLRDGANIPDLFSDDAEKVMSSLNRVKVSKGESYYIPAGLVHALRKGILVAEIQQNSDITYRIFDYGRKDKDGRPRELHRDKAEKCVSPFSPDQIADLAFENGTRDDRTIADCRYFDVKRIRFPEDSGYFLHAGDVFHSVVWIGGNSIIIHDGIEYPVCPADCYLIPAGSGDYSICSDQKSEVLVCIPKRVFRHSQKNKKASEPKCSTDAGMERITGLEPATSTLGRLRSTR